VNRVDELMQHSEDTLNGLTLKTAELRESMNTQSVKIIRRPKAPPLPEVVLKPTLFAQVRNWLSGSSE